MKALNSFHNMYDYENNQYFDKDSRPSSRLSKSVREIILGNEVSRPAQIMLNNSDIDKLNTSQANAVKNVFNNHVSLIQVT